MIVHQPEKTHFPLLVGEHLVDILAKLSVTDAQYNATYSAVDREYRGEQLGVKPELFDIELFVFCIKMAPVMKLDDGVMGSSRVVIDEATPSMCRVRMM